MIERSKQLILFTLLSSNQLSCLLKRHILRRSNLQASQKQRHHWLTCGKRSYSSTAKCILRMLTALFRCSFLGQNVILCCTGHTEPIIWGSSESVCLTSLPYHIDIFSQLLKSWALLYYKGLPWWLSVKKSACKCRRCSFDPWSGKILWRRKSRSNPLRYSCLGISMDRGAWWAIVHGVSKSQTT